jgi:hypothetical protein
VGTFADLGWVFKAAEMRYEFYLTQRRKDAKKNYGAVVLCS